MKIKTIDINAKEWFDRYNGNSYFSAQVTLNLGMKNSKLIHVPYEYGYGSFYEQRSADVLKSLEYIQPKLYEALWSYCQNNKIILRSNIMRGCLKRDVIKWGAANELV